MLLRAAPHLALSGHFLILAALYLVLRPGRHRQAALWLLLLVTAALVSAYLLLMAGACWLADLAAAASGRKKPWRRLMAEAVATVGAVLLALWQAGFLAESDKGAGGFGIYRFNLLSLVDANGWSYVLPDLPGGPGDYEGFNFLGAGLLVLAVFAVAALISGRVEFGRLARRWPFLLALLVGFTLFAMTNHIGIGPLDLTVPVPQRLLDIAGIFRASGRVFWPVFYVLLLAIAYVVVRGTPVRVGTTLLAAALVVQVADTSAYWRVSRSWLMKTPAATWPTPLASPFWDAAGTRYRELRRILPDNAPPGWDTLGYFAATHRMGTDIVYFPRIGQKRLVEARAVALKAMDTGGYRAGSLYIVDPRYLARVAAAIDPSVDLLAEVDGQYVVAPGWVTCGTCPPVDTLRLEAPGTAPDLGETIAFGLSQPTAANLLSGWSDPEPWGVWSLGPESRLLFAAPEGLSAISLVVDAFTPGEGMTQRVVASVNGHEALRTTVQGGGSIIDIPVSDDMRRAMAAERRLVITLGLPDAVSPVAAGVGTDPREIALGLRAVTFH